MTARLPLVLCSFLATLWLPWARPARAESVLFASSEARTAELMPELTLALRAHNLLLLARTLGDARTPLERAAAAQRIGRNVGTWAALWIEREPPLRVRAVAISGEQIFEAPLPAPLESVEPRVFASVASSVLLEALGRTQGGAPPSLRLDAAPAGPAAASAPPWTQDGSLSTPATAHDTRFFLRAGVGYGFVFLGQRPPTDRFPSSLLNEVADGAREPDLTIDLERADQLLRAHGYDCHVATYDMLQLMVDQCTVAVSGGGVLDSFSIDLAAGARIAPRLGLALTARVAPDAGQGVMAHALIGLQLEGALLKPRSTGLWLNGLAGLGYGRIQSRPKPAPAADAPYVTSGLANVRLGIQLGYRFTQHFGLYAGTTLHIMFPDQLTALEPTLGLEARL